MPDLSIEIMFMCASNDYTEQKVKGKTSTYTVTFSRGQWHCDCQGFKFRKTCSHIKQVKLCGWHQQAHGGDAKKTKDGWQCPKCGGEAIPIRVGV